MRLSRQTEDGFSFLILISFFRNLNIMNYNHHHYNKNLKEFARELRSESVSRAEKRIWKALLSRKQMEGFRFLRQRPIQHFIVDFFCPELKLIVEIDGNSHFNKPEYDRYRQDCLEALGYTVIRFNEGLVIQNLNEVHEKLSYAVFCLRSDGRIVIDRTELK